MVCTKSRKRKKSLAKHPSEKCLQSSSFLFLSNPNVIRHVNRSKTMFIMRGLPGSGKSALVKKIQAKYKEVAVCSADSYFAKDGEYEFNQDELSYAHQACKEKVKEACEAAVPVVVVDNTNIRRWEMNSYFGIAHQQNYDVILAEPDTPWKFDPVELAKRNSHGVTVEVIQQKLSHFETVFPLYYGWFLNEVDSDGLFKLGQDVFRRCMNVPKFSRIFRKVAGADQGNLTFDNFFNRKHFKTSIETLHCTTMFSLRGKKPETLDYIAKEAVEKAMGQVFMLSVIGFSISPRAFSARLRLNNTQLKLWFRDDHEERPAESPNSTPSPERVRGSANEGEKDGSKSKKSSRKKKSKTSDLSSKELVEGGASSENTLQPDSCSLSGRDDVKHLTVQPDAGIQFFSASSESGVSSWSSVVSSNKNRVEASPSKPNGGGSFGRVPGLGNGGTLTASASEDSSVIVTSHCSKRDKQPEDQVDKAQHENLGPDLAFKSDDDDGWFGAFDLGGHSSDEDLGNRKYGTEGTETDDICNNVTQPILDSKPNSGGDNLVSSSKDAASTELPIEPGGCERTSGPIMPIISDSPAGENTLESKGGENKDDANRPSCNRPISKVELFRTVGQVEETDDSSKRKETVSKIVELADKMVAFLEVCENHDEKGQLGSGLEINEVGLNSDLKSASGRVEICQGCDEVFENVDVVYQGGSLVNDGKSKVVGERKSGEGLVGDGAIEKKVESAQTEGRHRKTSRDKVDVGLWRQKRPSLELAEDDLDPLHSPGIQPEAAGDAAEVFSPVEKRSRVADVGRQGEVVENVGDAKKIETNPVVDAPTSVPVATDRKEDEIVVKKTLLIEKKPIIVPEEQMKSSKTAVDKLEVKTEREGSPSISKKKKKKKKKKKGEELESSVAMAGEVGCGENEERDQHMEGKTLESSSRPSADGIVWNEGEGTSGTKKKKKKKKLVMESSELNSLDLKQENTEKVDKKEKQECDYEVVAKKNVDLVEEGKENCVVKKKKKASLGNEPGETSDVKRPGGKKVKNIEKGSSVIDDEISAILFEIENAGSGSEKKGQRKKKGGRNAGSKISVRGTLSRKGDQEKAAKKKACIEKSPGLDGGNDDAQVHSKVPVCKSDSGTCCAKNVEEDGIKERASLEKESRGNSDTVIENKKETSKLCEQDTDLSVQTSEAGHHLNPEEDSDDGWQVVTKGGSHKSTPVVLETSPYLPNASDGPPKPKLKLDNQTSGLQQPEGATAVCFDLDSPEVDPSQKFRPTSGFGSRAHITIGCAENLSPVEAGYDLVEIIKYEARDGSDKSTFMIDGATVKHFGGGHFGVYLDKVVRFEALFGGYY